MPNMHGYDVIKIINKLDKIPKIGIITGWEEKLKSIDDEEFKVDFILKKPFKHAVLAKHINELFGK
jgi:DNA-binding LytR/AlgR family response regulator